MRDEEDDPSQVENDHDEDELSFSVDLRVFVVLIALAMSGSFMFALSLEGDLFSVEASRKDHLCQEKNENANLPDVHGAFFPSSLGRRKKDAVEDKESSGEHRRPPHGQHLLVDLAGVESNFLNSETRLAQALVDAVRASNSTLLSYHCHALFPSGVSCVGIMLDSFHISFHTWPEESVITLDLFMSSSAMVGAGTSLVPVIDAIERLFGIGVNVEIKWSQEMRGFVPLEDEAPHGPTNHQLDPTSDLSLWILSPMDLHSKKQVYSGRTKFQQVDIWDIVEVVDAPNYQDVQKYNITSQNDPRLHSPAFASPDRLLFLDGTIQSAGLSEAVYHEAMVHPAMFAHAGPRSVAIVGGGEGATLREVLKHNTVEAVTMIELDQELVELARRYLPKMSDCSDLVGRAGNCFDDDRLDLVFEDVRQWFMWQYAEEVAGRFDVILFDALDPEDDRDVSEDLYNDSAFLDAMLSSLSNDGVLAIQIGTAATIDDPNPDFGIYKRRERLFTLLEENDQVQAMLVYEEQHCGFLEPHSFLVVCRHADCRSRWYARSDQVDYQIYERLVRTSSGQRALSFYDGTTQRSYQWPKKGWETVYCRREPTPFECSYRHMSFHADMHELNWEDEALSSFRVESERLGNGRESTRVFATVNISKSSYVMPADLANSVELSKYNLETLQGNLRVGGGRVAVIEDLLHYTHQCGHGSSLPGSNATYLEIGASCLIRRVGDHDSANVEPWLPSHPSGRRPKFSPVYERNRISFDLFMVASRDIYEGEELLILEDVWSRVR